MRQAFLWACALLLAAGVRARAGDGECASISDAGCGCATCDGKAGGCPSCGGKVGGDGACGDACTDKPLELFPEVMGVKFGGWVQAGYHSQQDGAFNMHPDAVRIHQTWLWAEKKAQQKPCCWDWGFRTDVLYGVDAADTQAFGNDPGKWDYLNGFDHGIYGWALPQVYAEFAYDKLDVKIGHFFTLVGYEVVPAKDNFFYSHAFTQYYSEPFTHTGAIATYNLTDKLQLMGGWVLGWDTGYDTLDANRGNAIHSGVTWQLTKEIKFVYMMTGGSLGWRGSGYSHSLILDVALTEKLKYVVESDLVATDGAYVGGAFLPGAANDDFSLTQYLLYTVNPCWSFGGRLEWWNRAGSDAYELTGGVNWKPHPNFRLRPEVRYQWGDGLVNNLGLPDSSTIFGIDAIVTF